MTNPLIFDLKQCPLDGSNLLEAGAGTGKTYSLAYLYLRLILEKGLRVEEILVTTFTKAATAELKGRIFDTISTAERAFSALCKVQNPETELEPETKTQTNDFLLELLGAIRALHSDKTIQQRLRLALAQFDYAQVHTIDGFALHLLRENSDVIGTYVPEEILNDDSEFVKKAYLDLARTNFEALGEEAPVVGRAVTRFDSKSLFYFLSQLLTYSDYITDTSANLFKKGEEIGTLREKALNSDHEGAARELTQAIQAGKQLHGGSYKLTKLEVYTPRLKDPDAYSDEKLVTFFSQTNITEKANKDATIFPKHAFFKLCDELLKHKDALPMLAGLADYRALLSLTDVIREHVTELKAEQMALTHNDTVTRVAEGAHAIQTPLKAALIDEAQDTSPQQMTLFRALFLRENNTNANQTKLPGEEKAHSAQDAPVVFFVGDPKQAIYGFRGANIYTYLDIEDAVQRRYVMDTNYRSTEALNASVNAFFELPDVFLTDKKINYYPIGWDVKNDASDFGDKSLTLITAEKSENSDKFSKDDLAKTAATSLFSLLEKKLTLTEDNDKRRTIEPHDIAVLVRSGGQAISIKDALANIGLASSFTGKLSLYESDEAKLLLALLRAVNSGDTRIVKSLMLTPLLGYRVEDVNNNDVVTTLTTRLHQFASIYAKSSFSVMFYRLINQFTIAGRLLQSNDGKRLLTNFIQLFELLQVILQRQALSLSGLCDQLAKAIHGAKSEAELRLEDDSAITIMTMHSAKGLEFPVVCLPFFEYAPTNNQNNGLLISHQKSRAAPAFLKPADLIELVKSEETAEQRRLAYVALTRAKYHNIVIRQPIDSNKNKKDAMLTVLLGDKKERITSADFVADEDWLSSDSQKAPFADELDEAENINNINCTEKDGNRPTYRAKILKKPLYSAWQLESFSRLQQQATAHLIHDTKIHSTKEKGIDSLDNDNLNLENVNNKDSGKDETLIDGALMEYPAGARPGTALHEMYEHLLAHRKNDDAFRDAIEKSIDKHLFTKDKTNQLDTKKLADAVAKTTTITLAPNNFCLQDVDCEKQLIEMKFFLRLSPTSRQLLLDYFRLPPDVSVNEITPESLIPTDGYMHGYIDYLFEHEGKFYVLDYKSNRLGETLSDFDHSRMHTEMLHHRYDLQALIYTLALCKHLQVRTESDYDAQVGGYYYLFVRGMAHEKESGIYADKVPWLLLEELLSDTSSTRK